MGKLLLLGGLKYLIPVIKKAQSLGHYVVTCDYLPDNIAHQYADEYYNISILDRKAVLDLSEKLSIDGIMSFGVDPGVITAAYVSQQMGLPSPGPYESIKILQDKGLFRRFLKNNNFRVPDARTYSEITKALGESDEFKWPVIVKPVDSAGSKGVTKIVRREDLKNAIEIALRFSQSKIFIIEEFLNVKCASDSDSFSIDGEFKFISFSNQRFDKKSPNPYTPSAYSWPSSISKENQDYLKSELQRLISLLDMRSSVYNIEVNETENGDAYIMEVSPRGGGNRLSEMLEYSTGTDLISNAINAALGGRITGIDPPSYSECWAEVILYSNHSGIFEEIKVDPILDEHVIEIDLWVKKGDQVGAFAGANDAIGTLVLKFKTKEKLEAVLCEYSRFIEVVIT